MLPELLACQTPPLKYNPKLAAWEESKKPVHGIFVGRMPGTGAALLDVT